MKKRYSFLLKKGLYFGLIVGFGVFNSLNLLAQTAPVKQWDKTFGGSGMDILRTLQQTADGGYIVGGSSESGISSTKTAANKGQNDYWLLKIDSIGKISWDKTFGGSDNDILHFIEQTTDGCYILGGTSDSGIGGDKIQASKGKKDFWVVKLDANGNKIWDKTIGGSENDYLLSLVQTLDGGYVLGGTSSSGISGDKTQACNGFDDFWVVKLDMNGNKVWDKTFGGIYQEILDCIKQTTDGGFIAGGGAQIKAGEAQEFYVVKVDASGNLIWDKTFGGEWGDHLFSLQQTSDGGYILGGASGSGISGTKTTANKGEVDYWLVKLDANGNKNWDKTIGGDSRDELHSLEQTADGGYLLSGQSYSGISGDKSQDSNGSEDYWLVKVDATGNKVWDYSVGGIGSDYLGKMKPTSDGGYILGGYSDSGIGGDKTQPANGNNGDLDFWIVKLGPDLTKKPTSDCVDNIFPNPARGKINLQFCNLPALEAEITVYDLVGRLILGKKQIITENRLFTELELPVANEIYIVQIKAGEQIITRKFMIY